LPGNRESWCSTRCKPPRAPRDLSNRQILVRRREEGRVPLVLAFKYMGRPSSNRERDLRIRRERLETTLKATASGRDVALCSGIRGF